MMDDVRHLDAPGMVLPEHPERNHPVGVNRPEDVVHPVGEVHLHQRLDADRRGYPDHHAVRHADHLAGHLDDPDPVDVVHRLGEVRHQDVVHHLDEELDARCHRWRMGCLLHVVHVRLALEQAYPLDVACHLGEVLLRLALLALPSWQHHLGLGQKMLAWLLAQASLRLASQEHLAWMLQEQQVLLA